MKQFKDKIELLGTPPAGCMATMRVTVMALLVAFVLSSCTKDLSGGKVENGEEFTDLTIELLPPDDYSTAESRAQMEPTAQNLITDATVMVYSSDSIPTLTYFEKIKVVGNKLNFTHRTSTTVGEKFTIAVIANYPEFTPTLGDKKDELEKVFVNIDWKWAGEKFMMWGEITTPILSDKNSFKIIMFRSLARIDLGLGVYNVSRETWTGLADFDLKEVYVVNARNQFAVVPNAVKTKAGIPSVPVSAQALPNIEYSGGEIILVRNMGAYIKSNIFIAEAEKEGESAVYLIIGGRFGADIDISYYRIDLCTPSSGSTYNYLPLLRNYLYRITISDISKRGDPSIEKAVNPLNKNVKIDLKPITVPGDPINPDLGRPDDGGDIVFNDDSYIMTDVSEVHIYGEPDGIKSYSLFSVKASFPVGVDASITGENVETSLVKGVLKHISAVIPASTSGKTFDYTIKAGGLEKKVKVTVKPSIDAHFGVLPLDKVTEVKLVDWNSCAWATLSKNREYVISEQYPISLNTDSAKNKAYVHFHENIATEGAPRTMEMIANRASSTTLATSERTHFIVEQKNLSGRVVQGFGGDHTGDGYSANLAFECEEELVNNYEGESAVKILQWGFLKYLDIALNADVKNRDTGKKATIFMAKSEDHGIGVITRSNIYAARYCYEKNRDVDGNGTIDDSEVVWYLPSIEQLKKLSSLDNTTGVYWSSTLTLATEPGAVSNSTYSFNFATGVESSQSSSVRLNVRCVRDIPIK